MAWPTVAELKAEVLDIIQDASFGATDDTRLLRFFNDGLLEIASKVALPALATEATVVATTTQGYVALPVNYHWNLTRVVNYTRLTLVDVYQNRTSMGAVFPSGYMGVTGPVVSCAVDAGVLYYMFTPTEDETLYIYYHGKPTTLTGDASSPVCLPDTHARRLLTNYAAFRCFDRMEDGVEGQKINTAASKAAFDAAMADLMFFVGPLKGDGLGLSG